MSIVLDNLSKRYGNQWVVDNVSLEVAEGELFVLLGSSGSGKSTILRMIAGLTTPTGGRVMLNGRDVTAVAPQLRGTGFVFQNYSIFRHMSVAENIEFGLQVRKVPKAERVRTRERLLEMVGLSGLGGRYASQLSGGQQQRVALARALAYEPTVLLLDEPFGALDVKIRAQLRRSLKEVQRSLGVTTILVTHDQEEAFELADRIGVLERGRLLESGAGEALYARPRSLFAATFLGAGTVLVGRAEGGRAQFGCFSLPIPAEAPHEDGARVQLLFRPEQVTLSSDQPTDGIPVIGKGAIAEETFTGPLRRVRIKLPRPTSVRQIAPALAFGEEGLIIEAALPSDSALPSNELWISLEGWTILNQAPPRLLVYDEGRGSTVPLALGRLISERLEASTTLLAVAGSQDGLETLQTALEQRRSEAGIPNGELRLRHGHPADQIAAEQAESVYEMLVIGASRRVRSVFGSRVSRLPGVDSRIRMRRLGDTLISVLADTDIPVLVARGDRPVISRVLICTAAGEPGKADVRVGGRLARNLGAAVTLLYVSRRWSEPDRVTREHLDRATATLRAFDLESEVRVRQDSSPAHGILREAVEGKHDLIVIGCYGHRSPTFLETNDVMLQVLAEADRPVLVVPTDRV